MARGLGLPIGKSGFMTHIWVRAEQRASEARVGVTPDSVGALLRAGFDVSVEHSSCRAIGIDEYRETGCAVVPENSWPDAPRDAIIFGLKELPEDGTDLVHRHIMFGHAFKGQSDGPDLLRRFKNGGGCLYDLEYLTEPDGVRVAAFGYWAGYAGAAVGIKTWACRQAGDLSGPAEIGTYANKDVLLAELHGDLAAALTNGAATPDAIVVGALGRVGRGAGDLLAALGLNVTKWDMAETARGGPFPEILQHDLFVNCVLAGPDIPQFVPKSALAARRRLSVIADVSCDPNSAYNPIPVYDHATSFDAPVLRVHDAPVLDVTAIDNLPSMLPLESSQDFAAQLLPSLLRLDNTGKGVWARARAEFDRHIAKI